MPTNPTLTNLKEKVDKFRDLMPIVSALRNTYLQPYHWDEIRRRIKIDLNVNDENFTLKTMIDMDLYKFLEDIQDVSNQAI